MLSVLCLYLVNICLIFSILYMLHILLMARRGPGSGWGRGRLRKHDLPPRTRAPSTTSTMPASTTPATNASSAIPGYSPHFQEFVMIPNPGYVELGPQPLILPHSSPSPPTPPGGEARTSPVLGSASSLIPSQPGSHRTQAFSPTPSQGCTNQHVELKYDGKS